MSDKGARKRKAALKLNRISARLQEEKKSPENEDLTKVNYSLSDQENLFIFLLSDDLL